MGFPSGFKLFATASLCVFLAFPHLKLDAGATQHVSLSAEEGLQTYFTIEPDEVRGDCPSPATSSRIPFLPQVATVGADRRVHR